MLDALLKGTFMGLMLAISIGPIIFSVIKQSLNNGREGGLSFVSGVWVSDLLLIFLCNGFSEMVQQLMDYQFEIGLCGGLVLMGMGLFYLFMRKKASALPMENTSWHFRKKDFARIFSAGFLLNTLNPNVVIFWITTTAACAITSTSQERLLIFATCMAITMGADVLKVFLAGKIRHRLTEKTIHQINKISGTLLILFGFVLLWGTLVKLGPPS